ncbi:MAG: hypothetical protein K2M23_01790 [Alphaproteobacteria bacterium]|nr:hypothetical protein [Alphaproteobacteria bacterium]
MLKLSKSYQNNYGIHSKNNLSKYFKLSLFVFAAMFFTLNGTPTFSADSKIVCKSKCKDEPNKALKDSCMKKCK